VHRLDPLWCRAGSPWARAASSTCSCRREILALDLDSARSPCVVRACPAASRAMQRLLVLPSANLLLSLHADGELGLWQRQSRVVPIPAQAALPSIHLLLTSVIVQFTLTAAGLEEMSEPGTMENVAPHVLP